MNSTRHTPGGTPAGRTCSAHKATRTSRGFTLIEMLTVISIIGIIAALSVPVVKNFGKADVTVSASRQMLDDIGYARQLAMSQRTTVYMVFVPTNFFNSSSGVQNNTWLTAVNNAGPQAANALTNVLDKQLTGYTYMAYGALGDQPGKHAWHYLAPWQNLPDGAFIPMWKFYNPNITNAFADPVNANYSFTMYPFSTNNTFPFPTVAVTNSLPILSYIAFNYLGQLSDYSGQLLGSADRASGQDYDQDFVGGGVDIPISQGSVIAPHDPTTKALVLGAPQVVENPPGNTMGMSYNVIHIDPLTGRATLEYHKMQ